MSDPTKQNVPGWGRWLKIGGILCALGGVSALVLTALNLLTDPLIREQRRQKVLSGYRTIYASLQSVSDPTAVDDARFADLAEYFVAYGDQNRQDEIGHIYRSKSVAVKSYGALQAMVGISGTVDAPVLGKVYLVEDSMSYKNVFEANYVDPYNADPGEATLDHVQCGATFGANALRAIVQQARAHYASLGDAYAEDLAADVREIWDGDGAFDPDNAKETLLSGYMHLRKSYSFYEDETLTGEIGRLYAGKCQSEGGELWITIGMTGSEAEPRLGKMRIGKNTLADSSALLTYVAAYNANPGEAALAATSDDVTESVKRLAEEAKAAFLASRGLSSSASRFAEMVPDFVSFGGPTAIGETTKTAADAVTLLRSWPLYGGDATKPPLAHVYKIRALMATESDDGYDISSDTLFLVAISGDAANPLSGKTVKIRNMSGGGSAKAIDAYLETGEVKTGGTYTLDAIRHGIDAAKRHYQTAMGGTNDGD